MGMTKIPWCDKTWNPITGCTKISAGCANCYAHAMHARFGKGPFVPTFHPDRLDEPLRWRKPSRVFVCSMGDLLHEDVPAEAIAGVFLRAFDCPQHTFIILTKRPHNMMTWCRKGNWNPLPNVWLGVSVENQQAADERVPILLQTPAAVRFVSMEPLIGPVSIPRYALGVNAMCDCKRSFDQLGMPSIEPDYMIHAGCPQCGKPYSKTTGINWIIVGAESGPGARPCDPSWVRSIIAQGTAAGVPLFVKQWRPESEQNERHRGTLVKMPAIDGKVYAQWPEVK
jgi:protein gp37